MKLCKYEWRIIENTEIVPYYFVVFHRLRPLNTEAVFVPNETRKRSLQNSNINFLRAL